MMEERSEEIGCAVVPAELFFYRFEGLKVRNEGNKGGKGSSEIFGR